MHRRQRPKSSQRGKKREKGKWLSKEALQIAEKRSKKQRRKGKKYLNEFRVKLKKVGKTTRPLRYDLNQIPYDYTVEVRNRFKGPDLIDRVHDELWNEVRDIVQETGMKTIPMEKKCKRAKWLCEEALQIAVKKREAKS